MEKELWLIWKDSITRRRYTIGTLIKKRDEYIFRYNIDVIEEIKKIGFDYFPGFEDIEKEYNSKELFTNILNRLPNPSRTDYEQILKAYELSKECSVIEILERTKGRLLTDNYEFVPAFNKDKIEFDLAGTRHCRDFDKCKEILKVGDKLNLELEEDNKYDNNAIKVLFEDYKIGYVPRYYSKQLADLLKQNIKYKAEINNIKIETLIKNESVSAKVELIFK